jgi:hypothetical protein
MKSLGLAHEADSHQVRFYMADRGRRVPIIQETEEEPTLPAPTGHPARPKDRLREPPVNWLENGCEKQPLHAVSHARHSSPLPAYRTGTDKVSVRHAATYTLEPCGVFAGAHFPPTGSELEARMLSQGTGRAPYRYPTLDGLPRRTNRHCEGTCPRPLRQPAKQLRGPKRPRVVAPNTVPRHDLSQGHPTPTKWYASRFACQARSCTLIPILTATKTRNLSETESGSSTPIGFVSFVLSWPQCRFWGCIRQDIIARSLWRSQGRGVASPHWLTLTAGRGPADRALHRLARAAPCPRCTVTCFLIGEA